MPTECTVTLFRIAVESNVLNEEMLECLQEWSIPTLSLQNRPKHFLQPFVLVACDAQRSAYPVHGADSSQIALTNGLKTTLPAFCNPCQIQRSAHKFIVIHPLPDFCNPWPRRKIVRIPFALIELPQSTIFRIEIAGYFKILAKLD